MPCYLIQEFNTNCWDNPVQGKQAVQEKKGQRQRGLHRNGRWAEAVFIVGKGIVRARVQAASTNIIKIKGKILFASPDDNSDDKMIHSPVLLGASERLSTCKEQGSHITPEAAGPHVQVLWHCVPRTPMRNTWKLFKLEGFLFRILNLRNYNGKLKHMFLAEQTNVFLYKSY